jgi:hypothetical protein
MKTEITHFSAIGLCFLRTEVAQSVQRIVTVLEDRGFRIRVLHFGAHPDSYAMDTRAFSTKLKRPKREARRRFGIRVPHFGAHPDSYTMDTQALSTKLKRPRREARGESVRNSSPPLWGPTQTTMQWIPGSFPQN